MRPACSSIPINQTHISQSSSFKLPRKQSHRTTLTFCVVLLGPMAFGRWPLRRGCARMCRGLKSECGTEKGFDLILLISFGPVLILCTRRFGGKPQQTTRKKNLELGPSKLLTQRFTTRPCNFPSANVTITSLLPAARLLDAILVLGHQRGCRALIPFRLLFAR